MTRDPKWIADSGASFHMTHSADLLSDVRLGDYKVRVGDNHLIDVMGYGTLTVVFPGDLTVKLLDVAYATDIAFNLFSLVAAHKRGVGFTTEEKDLCISLFTGRLRFCLLYTSPSPRDQRGSRMPSSA